MSNITQFFRANLDRLRVSVMDCAMELQAEAREGAECARRRGDRENEARFAHIASLARPVTAALEAWSMAPRLRAA